MAESQVNIYGCPIGNFGICRTLLLIQIAKRIQTQRNQMLVRQYNEIENKPNEGGTNNEAIEMAKEENVKLKYAFNSGAEINSDAEVKPQMTLWSDENAIEINPLKKKSVNSLMNNGLVKPITIRELKDRINASDVIKPEKRCKIVKAKHKITYGSRKKLSPDQILNTNNKPKKKKIKKEKASNQSVFANTQILRIKDPMPQLALWLPRHQFRRRIEFDAPLHDGNSMANSIEMIRTFQEHLNSFYWLVFFCITVFIIFSTSESFPFLDRCIKLIKLYFAPP